MTFDRKSRSQVNADYRTRNLEKVKENQRRNSVKYREKCKLNMSDDEKKRKLFAGAERQRKWREKQKENKLISAKESPYFPTPQIQGKAIKKVRKALTESSVQNTFILKKLLKENSNSEINLNESDSQHPRSLPNETIKLVEQFYLNDDFSRQSPNMHDKIKVKENGEIVEKRIKHLMYTLKELYGIFKRDNPDVQINFIKFYYLKPKHVYLQSKIDHNVCCCAVHENLRCALKPLKKIHPIFNDLFIDNCMHKNFTCDPPSFECFMNKCTACCDSAKLKKLAENLDTLMDSTSWWKWLNKKELDGIRTNPYSNTEKVLKSGTTEELLKEVYDQVPDFLEHEYVKIEQSKACKLLVEEASKNDSFKAVLQCDFAEKFKCFSQNETQAAHYGQMPVTIFTCAIYHRGLRQIVIVSDCEDQNKESVIPFLYVLLSTLPETVLQLEGFSDNAPSQFKNQYVMESLKTFQKKFQFKIRWNFFAEMHGKSIVDGIGGAVKYFVHRRILADRATVKTASDFAQIAKSDQLKIETILVSKSDIETLKHKLNFNTIISQSKPIKGIKKLHSLWVEEKKTGKKIENKINGSNITNIS